MVTPAKPLAKPLAKRPPWKAETLTQRPKQVKFPASQEPRAAIVCSSATVASLDSPASTAPASARSGGTGAIAEWTANAKTQLRSVTTAPASAPSDRMGVTAWAATSAMGH